MLLRGPLLICLSAAVTFAGAGPSFSFTDTAGHPHTRAEWAGKRAIVLYFTSTDCPLANGYVPEMNRIAQAYHSRGVAFYAVQGDATIAAAEVVRHAKEYNYAYPYLFDPSESLASYTGATTVPEVAVLSPSGALLYLGRIDNLQEDFGKQRLHATEFDLRDALDAVLSGKAVPRPRTKTLGCAITRKN
jgi:peroxiredoxin